MKIIISNEAERKLIISLCDVAYRNGGMESNSGVQLILRSMENEPVKEIKIPDESNT